METSEEPYPAKRSKAGKVVKKRTKKSSLQLVDEFGDEGVPENEPRIGDEEADLQKAYNFNASKVQGKGKEKVSNEQVALDLLTLQTPKKRSLADQILGNPDAGVQDEGQVTKHLQMDEGIHYKAYHKCSENLQNSKTKGEVRLEEPASSAGTLSSQQNLDKELSFTNQFLSEKSQEDEPEKTNIEARVQSMVTVSKAVDEIVTDAIDWAIQAPLRDRFRDLPEADMKEILHHRMWESNSYQAHKDHKMLYEALEKSMARDHTDQLLIDLAEARKKKKKRRDSPKTPPGSPPHQPPPPPPPAGSSGTLGASRASGASGASGSSQLPPPPPPPYTNQSDQSTSTAAPSSSKTAASAEYTAWTTTDTRLKPSVLSIPEELHMDDDTTHDEQVQSSGDEDIGHDHIPTVNLRQNWWKPLTEDRPATPEPAWSIPSSDLPVPVNNWASALASTYAPPLENSLLAQTGDMAIFMDWFCKKQGITELKQQDLEGPAYEIVKVFHPNVIHLQYQMEECHKLLTDQVDESIIRYNVSKPLPLGGPPGQVTIQSDFFFNKDLEYLRYGRKSGRPALSISKMKAAYYPDVGLEQMVPDQMWIEEE
ncbi:hypothetical protein Tco_1363381 [Tanacetum coccineum]